MPAGQSFRKIRDVKVDTGIGDAKPSRKKNGCIFKKKLCTLNLFPGHSRNKMTPEKNLLFEDKKRGLQRKESKKVKASREQICSLGKSHSGKMCPKCEIIICKVCNTLHTERSFIAHSLLDHYDKGRPACCTRSPHHVCENSLEPAWLMSDLVGTAH